MKNWFYFLFKKRLPTNLFFTLPIVLGFTAFSSGFIALLFIDQFLLSANSAVPPDLAAEMKELVHFIRREILIFTVLGGVAGFAIAYAIHRSVTQLTVRTRQVAQGDFSARMEVEALDELGILGKDFNLMVSSLSKYFIDSMTAGWFLLDKFGKIISINPGAQIILGCSSEDLVGKHFGALSKYVSVQFSEAVIDTIENQKPNTREIDLETADGRNIRVSLATTLLKGADDTFVGVAAILKNLTQAGEITEHMQRADKLSALGIMAAGLAHEIRNPLGAIKGLTQLLHEKFPEGDPSRAYTQTMVKEVDRLNEVISNLLNFARPGVSEFEFCDVNHLLEQAIALLQLDAESKKVQLVKNLSSSLPPVWADGRKLVQAFLNVLRNAAQAVNLDKQNTFVGILVESRLAPKDAGKDGSVVIEIANSGSPVDPMLGGRIFDPFVTTKKEGIGLGLAITHQIVTAHRGEISFGSRDGLAVFTFRFPLTETQNKDNRSEVPAING